MRVSDKVLGDYLNSIDMRVEFEEILGSTMQMINWREASNDAWNKGAIKAWCDTSTEPWRTVSANWEEHLIELGVQ